MVIRIWPPTVAGKADNVSSVSASACHIGGPNSVNPGQMLLVYATVHLISAGLSVTIRQHSNLADSLMYEIALIEQ